MLGFRWRFVLELFEGVGDIPGHGEMYLVVGIVPVKVYADVSVPSPISAKRVISFDHCFEVHRMFFPYEFYSKIVYHEGEPDGSPIMRPQARDEFALFVTVFVEPFFKQDVGNEARVW